MKRSSVFKFLGLLTLLPLTYALGLALYFAFDFGSLIGFEAPFARINAYIYGHSFGVIITSLWVGLQLSFCLQNHTDPKYFWGNGLIFLLAWASFRLYANAYGVAILLMAVLMDWLLNYWAHQEQITPIDYWQQKSRISLLTAVLLGLIIMINQ